MSGARGPWPGVRWWQGQSRGWLGIAGRDSASMNLPAWPSISLSSLTSGASSLVSSSPSGSYPCAVPPLLAFPRIPRSPLPVTLCLGNAIFPSCLTAPCPSPPLLFYAAAQGRFHPSGESKPPVTCPVAFDVSIEEGACLLGTRRFDLPISGPGRFEILYGDDSVRVFRSSGGVAVQVPSDWTLPEGMVRPRR